MDIFNAIPLDERLLGELVRIARHYNIAPMKLPFYTGPKSIHPVAAPFEALAAECRALLYALSDNEILGVVALLPDWYRRMEDLTPPLVPREPMLDRLSRSIIQWAVQVQGIDFRAAVRNEGETSAVLKKLPKLRNSFDDDGLLVLDGSFQLDDGGIFYNEFVLHYHQLLRRGYAANPNFDFLGFFARYFQETSPENSFRVAIDHSRIMERQWYEHLIEKDTWFGPPFDPEKLDDPKAVGLTVVGRNQNSLFRQYNKLRFTDFLWTYRDSIKTFQVEEVSDPDYTFGPYNFNKYVHSERDTERQVLRHLDGAVKVYLKEQYAGRLDAHLPKVPRCFVKPKLFRIDGQINLQAWIDLICLFMKGNEMVIEYLNPKAFEEAFELRVRDFEAWKRQQTEPE